MKSALSDFILGKKGIYGILHIIILLMSLFLVISISIDTFKGIPFYTQSSYMKIQLWICLWFLFDFVLEFFLAKHKWRYCLLWVDILSGGHLSASVYSFVAGRICTCYRSRMAYLQPGFEFVRLLSDDVAGNGLFRQSCLLCT